MKLSTILSNYGEFQTSYKKIGYSQDKINIKNKTEVRLLLDKVISDIVIFNDLLNLYDYSQSEKNQILRALNKLGLKRETFMQILVQKNYDNYIEDASILQDDYSDMQLFESEIQEEIEDMTFITENDEEFEEIIDTDEDYTLEDEDGYDVDMEDEFESLNESVDLTKIKLSSSSNDFDIIEYYAGIIKFKKYKIQIGKCLIGEGVYPFLSVNNEIDIYSDNEYETLLLVDDMTFSDEDIKNYLKEIKIKDSDLEEVVNEIVDNFDEYLKKIFKQCKKYQ